MNQIMDPLTNVQPVVLKIMEASIALAKEDFASGNFSIRLIPTSRKRNSRYRYTVDCEDGQLTSGDMKRYILKRSGVEIAKMDDLMDALEKAEEMHFLILEALVKESKSLNGYFDKAGNKLQD